LMRVDEAATDALRRRLALRLVVFGGEALELQSLRGWFERHGDSSPRLVNMYGITETTVHVTYRPVRMADVESGVGSVIGRPIPDLELYILDPQREPAPLGVAGELYVGGSGVARGYLNRPELTAERFIPNPFSEEPGARLYKSGDMARRLDDGDVEYVGRADEQVKVRGFRIELGEIEAAVASHPSVREAAVLAREDVPGDKQLVAYVAVHEAARVTLEELRSFLQERLPDYMVPPAFVFMGALPLTPNGKVDRRALPAPDRSRPELEESYAPPTTPAEETLARVWSEVLGVERVGIHDNFFNLGGDSIRSIQVRAAAQGAGLDFSIQQLFQHQTVHELARVAASVAAADAPAARPRTEPFALVPDEDRRLLPEDVEDAYPPTMLQRGMLFHMELTPDSPVYHNVNSLRLRAPFDERAFREAVQRVVARHPVLRTSFALRGYSEPLQLVRREAELPVLVEDLRGDDEAAQERLIDEFMAAERGRRFDVTRAPLLRFAVHRRGEDNFQFTLTENHAILDGWSLHSTLAEIFGLYFDLLGGAAPPPEPPPAVAFRDFVLLERETIESEEARGYWTRKLAGQQETKLPRRADAARDATGPRVRVRVVPITPELSEGLKRAAQAAGVPLKSVLLAAHLKVLSLLAGGAASVTTALATHGRPEEAGGDEVRGLFLNTVPFDLRLGDCNWLDLARETFRAEQEMHPFRRFPLAALPRVQGWQPPNETLFNFVHFHVVDGLVQSGDVQVLGFKKFEATNYKLIAGFSVSPVTSQVALELDYDSAELSEAQLDSMAALYAGVLGAMALDPRARHGASSFLPEEERHRLLHEWNEAGRDFPTACLHELFERQAERAPDAVALVYEGERLSYGELNARANRLARRLRAAGVGPESLVGLLLERSAETVVAILGVLKAGGAYVPLDPSYPAERLRFMLEDAGMKVLLTERGLLERLPGPRAEAVLLDAER
ncbi:MAG: AMP-binding protein, partial [Acidobacteriota bacterium]|nr:AMP-binding protein [Acidobacteriota bacterium]